MDTVSFHPSRDAPELASFRARVAARLIDAALVLVAAVVLLGEATGAADPDGLGAARIAVAIGPFAYEWLMLGSRGQTLGRMWMGIAVREARTAGSISYLRALARIVAFQLLAVPIAVGVVGALPPPLLPVLMIPLAAGILAALRDPHRRTWHDRAAGTIVVRVAR